MVGRAGREAGYALLALTIDYGQRRRVEHEAESRIAAGTGPNGMSLPLDLRAFGGSALIADIACP